MDLKAFFKQLGPGLITGAAGDDPAGIGTYSQTGARFGFGTLWFALFQFPMLLTVQEMCGRIGLLTGKGLTSIIKDKYSKLVYPIASLLLIANTINIGADLGAMSASVRLLFPQLPMFAVLVCFAFFIVVTIIILSYKRYVNILRYLTLALFAYVITAIMIGGNATEILVATLTPRIEFTPAFAMIFVALFGSTITPYAFFWQASQEVEENVAKNKIKEMDEGTPKITKRDVKMMRMDTIVGMAFSQMIMWFIILTSATSLHAHGITNISTADQAAKALEPLVHGFPQAGKISEIIFVLGIVGTGLLAIPVLATSSAYALAGGFGWKQGLSKKFKQAKSFYLVIIVSTVTGIGINFANVDPITALVYSAVINGVIAVPLLIVIMAIANDKRVLKNKTNGKTSNIIGGATIIIMAFSVSIMVLGWILNK